MLNLCAESSLPPSIPLPVPFPSAPLAVDLSPSVMASSAYSSQHNSAIFKPQLEFNRINLVKAPNDVNTIYAQSELFNITASGTTATSSGAGRPTTAYVLLPLRVVLSEFLTDVIMQHQLGDFHYSDVV